MNKLLTPKQVAEAIQVSESSVKRWCDAGVIPTEYTAGGHRRITMPNLLQFVRSTRHKLVEPGVVELTISGEIRQIDQSLIDRFTSALVEGCEAVGCQVLIELYLAGLSVSVICDSLILPAFCRIGDLWKCGEAEVFQERLACEICHRAIHELRSLLPDPPIDAPLAIGGTPPGDPYSIATSLAELVLRGNQWRATSLGCNLPFATLEAAIREQQPRLFWLSVSHIPCEQDFVEGYRALYASRDERTALVVGGQALTESIRQQINYAAFCDNMQHLESFVQTVGQH